MNKQANGQMDLSGPLAMHRNLRSRGIRLGLDSEGDITIQATSMFESDRAWLSDHEDQVKQVLQVEQLQALLRQIGASLKLKPEGRGFILSQGSNQGGSQQVPQGVVDAIRSNMVMVLAYLQAEATLNEQTAESSQDVGISQTPPLPPPTLDSVAEMTITDWARTGTVLELSTSYSGVTGDPKGTIYFAADEARRDALLAEGKLAFAPAELEVLVKGFRAQGPVDAAADDQVRRQAIATILLAKRDLGATALAWMPPGGVEDCAEQGLAHTVEGRPVGREGACARTHARARNEGMPTTRG